MRKSYLAFSAAAFALLLLSAPAVACDKIDALLKKAYPAATATKNGFEVSGDYLRRIDPDEVACKAWPARPELTLVAVPLIEANPPQEGENKGDVEIILADTASGRPIARRLEKDMAFSDAVRFANLSFDTARYDLKAGLRAFGVRTMQANSSQIDPFSETALWLYTFEGGRIDRVLDGLIVERENGENNGDCDGALTTINRTLTLGGAGPKGYRDLVVDQTETLETSKKDGTDCKSTDAPGAGRQVVLHFGDRHYDPPAGSKSEPDKPESDLFSFIEIGAPGGK